MTKRRQILIGCPQYQRLVRGTYACGPDGGYDRDADGSFLLDRTQCSHHGGRCAQTLCVLHRYNRGGSGSWYPSRLLALGGPKARQQAAHQAGRKHEQSNTDLLC